MPRKKNTPLISPDVASDPVVFVETILGGKPHQKQVDILRGYKQTTSIEWGRQAGKSRGVAWLGDWYITTHQNRELLLLAPSLDQTRIIFDQIAADFRKPPLSYLVDGKIKEYPFPEIRLINGSKLYARGANSPQFVRGHSPHLVIGDEASFFKDGTIAQVIEPLQTVTSMFPDSALILISTPFGEGEFNSIARQCESEQAKGNPKFAYFHATSLDNPYANKERLYAIRDRYGEESLIWKQEYLAIADVDDLAVFNSKDIKWALHNYPYDEFPHPVHDQHKYVQGVDLANRSDYFVSSILDITDKNLAHFVHMDRFNQRGWKFNKNTIRENYHRFHRAQTCIDATTLAESVVEELEDIHPEGYRFTGTSAKYEVVHELVRMFAEHRLTLPNNQDVINELRHFQYEITPSKNIRMEAKDGFHDDIVMSLSLAAHLALKPHNTGFFMPVEMGNFRKKNTNFEFNQPNPFQERLMRPRRMTKEEAYAQPNEWAELFRFDE